jgi:hypothetical protein
MVFNIGKAIIAVVVAVVVGIVLVGLLGPVIISLKVPIATTVGEFFKNWGFVIGVLSGLWYYFKGV